MFLILLISIIILFYFLNNHLHSFWKKRGFKQLQPSFLVGDTKPVFSLKSSFGEHLAEVYHKFKDLKMFGFYMFYFPTLIITDPKIVQDVLIRDFSSFTDRPLAVDEENDPLSAHLFTVQGQMWRDMRVKLVSIYQFKLNQT
jgi:cytochrome P450 family 6